MASQSATHSYTVLPEQSQEDALHATRLLQVEERPFQRVTRNLLGKDSLLKWTPPKQLPSPPPEGGEGAEDATDDRAEADMRSRRQKFREEVLLDFAALESSILRIQLIQSSNARERERYAAEKAKILETAQGVRDNTLNLRNQLADAQRVLELRKGYDELAAKLIDPKKSKPRADTQEDINKLEKELEDLEQENADFENVWILRREAFDKVVAEGQNLVKVIKGIKDEPEHEKEDERMDDGDGEKGEERSRLGTPVPDGRTPMPADGGGHTPLRADVDTHTPRPGGQTPFLEGAASPSRPTNKFLDVEDVTRSSSRAGSPMAQASQPQEDVDMVVEDQAGSSTLQEQAEDEMTVGPGENKQEEAATPVVETEVMDET
ncbi:hypothetical protein LTR37_011183 [Vermiconidia calcicola]|uniref:Uncharacterized protein n=1 Tax=Vermiconidia calcicola TaxID=1690605 RepID=A0ACC3N3K1_9PEZI|nr:hypothetical protein LTR37_011183 [Vermiconidia calcicola]